MLIARRRFFQLLALVVATALCAGAAIAFRGAGRWLIRPDALAPADVIVVLSGSMPARAEEAARIYRLKYAREVWISRPENPAQGLAAMGIRYLGEEDYNREILICAGVPEKAVRVFPEPIVDTEQEVEETVREMRREGKASAIIVTSPQHTRRVRALWRRLAGPGLRAIVRGAPKDPFDADRWWRNTRDAFSVAREILGLLNAWAGLPVRPHSH
ncbi:MAG TPA: YdcF family protein [Candidatus Polarisedimenticolia bacterium]|nr:YdcF family protein [Candidatus Polarisedimenticolia bacterium]